MDEQLREYAKARLTDGIFRELRKTILEGPPGATISLEVQDLYLADPSLPSNTGRLVEANWRRYPYLGTSLELIKKGTYSALTRSLVLLAVTPRDEILAFPDYDAQHNPMRISEAQALVFLFCLLDNDAEVIFPLFRQILNLEADAFDERVAGELLGGIFRQVVRDHEKRSVTAEERDRLALLTKTASSIEQWKGKSYSGGGAREESVRVRLEPFCDLGFLAKASRERYEYRKTDALRTLLNHWEARVARNAFAGAILRHICRLPQVQCTASNRRRGNRRPRQGRHRIEKLPWLQPDHRRGAFGKCAFAHREQRVLELSRTTELLKRLQSWTRTSFVSPFTVWGPWPT